MNEMQQEMQRAAELLRASDHILILGHRSVDGDAYGSSMALAFSLRLLGKDVQVVNEIPVASEHHFLWYHEEVQTSIPPIRFDCIVACDCGEYRRIGRFWESHATLFRDTPIINIDHHLDNDRFGTINIVDSKASSTCEVLFSFLRDHSFPKDERIYTLMLYGILRDTNCFKNSMGPGTFAIMDVLYRMLPREIYDRIILHAFKTVPLNILRVCAEAILESIVLRGWLIVGGVITQEMLGRYELIEPELGDYLINEILPSVQGAAYTFLIKETEEWLWKVRFRAREDGYDVSRIAKKLGWGGHLRAAAALSSLSLEEIIQIIEETDIREINQNV